MTAHEHWLICPMHLLWKYDREPCDGPNCVSCCLNGPPAASGVAHVARDRARSCATSMRSFSRAATAWKSIAGAGSERTSRLVHLPYFLPDGWSKGIENEPPAALDRPYLAAAGRLVKMKGFQRLIPLMRYLPEVDLRIAGTGPYEGELRALAADLPNVQFEGLLGGEALARLFRSAARSSCRPSSPRRSATSSSRLSRWALRSWFMKTAARFSKPAS